MFRRLILVVVAAALVLILCGGCPPDSSGDNGGGAGGNVDDNNVDNNNGDDVNSNGGNDSNDSGASGSGSGSSTAIGAVVEERLRATDFAYQGAFRLPDEFNWGARGLSFYPDGSDGAGSLLVTGFELLMDPAHPNETCGDPSWGCGAYYGEVTIPAPTAAANWEDLPVATLSAPLIEFDGGLASSVHREYVFVSDLEYVPQRGSQTSAKLYGDRKSVV